MHKDREQFAKKWLHLVDFGWYIGKAADMSLHSGITVPIGTG
jgi:hypothetical protein